jgi:hypothetical protein
VGDLEGFGIEFPIYNVFLPLGSFLMFTWVHPLGKTVKNTQMESILERYTRVHSIQKSFIKTVKKLAYPHQNQLTNSTVPHKLPKLLSILLTLKGLYIAKNHEVIHQKKNTFCFISYLFIYALYPHYIIVFFPSQTTRKKLLK